MVVLPHEDVFEEPQHSRAARLGLRPGIDLGGPIELRAPEGVGFGDVHQTVPVLDDLAVGDRR